MYITRQEGVAGTGQVNIWRMIYRHLCEVFTCNSFLPVLELTEPTNTAGSSNNNYDRVVAKSNTENVPTEVMR